MTNHEMLAFAQLLTAISALYNKAISEMLIELYWRSLKRFEFQAVQNAFMAYIDHTESGQFMPKPADIIRMIEGDVASQALQAWSKVEQAIRVIGRYSTIVFDDPIIHAVITDMSGWIHLCNTSHKELNFRANEFTKRYRGYLLKKPTVYPKQLTGFIEQYNGQHGYKLEPPVLFGNPTLALQIYQQGNEPRALNNTITPLSTPHLTQGKQAFYLENPTHFSNELFHCNSLKKEVTHDD